MQCPGRPKRSSPPLGQTKSSSGSTVVVNTVGVVGRVVASVVGWVVGCVDGCVDGCVVGSDGSVVVESGLHGSVLGQ